MRKCFDFNLAMRRRLAGLLMAAWCAAGGAGVFAQTNTPAAAAPAAEAPVPGDKEGCEHNLKTIYAAIQAYRADHKEIPNWISDLVPKYLPDPNVLICPACKRTGAVETSKLADPKLPCSYLYEFCPVPLTAEEAPGAAGKTRRDLKRRQMGLAGAIVPILRCYHHDRVINVSFDGRIYESPPAWQALLTNQLNVADLQPGRIFPAPKQAADGGRAKTLSFAPRDPGAPANLIDLTAHYNAGLAETWTPVRRKNDLSGVPLGVQKLDGVLFDIRGAIHLDGAKMPTGRFPKRVNGIKIQRACARLHFLHATDYGGENDEGQQVGTYIVHLGTNELQLEIPVVYGRDLRNWHQFGPETDAPGLTVAWSGTNEFASDADHRIRLFTSTWSNSVPEMRVESIDFVSAGRNPAPFVVAVTAD